MRPAKARSWSVDTISRPSAWPRPYLATSKLNSLAPMRPSLSFNSIQNWCTPGGTSACGASMPSAVMKRMSRSVTSIAALLEVIRHHHRASRSISAPPYARNRNFSLQRRAHHASNPAMATRRRWPVAGSGCRADRELGSGASRQRRFRRQSPDQTRLAGFAPAASAAEMADCEQRSSGRATPMADQLPPPSPITE